MEDKKVIMNANLWKELRSRQRSDGSWDYDMETTMIASNAITQNTILLDEKKDKIDFEDNDSDADNEYNANTKSVEGARNWTTVNYDKDAEITTQVMVNYNYGAYASIGLRITNVDAMLRITNDQIITLQEENGSWDNDVKQTSFALYTLKENRNVGNGVIDRGESWLVDQQDEDHLWGGIQNDSFAILALHDTSIDLEPVVANLISSQEPRGSFGDIETTAWAAIALTLYDSKESRDSAKKTRTWLLALAQDDFTDRELALVTLADVEYMTSEISHLENEEIINKEKGPPLEFLYSVSFVIITLLALLIVYIRLRKDDVLNGVRRDVFSHIKLHPGVNQNKLKRELGLSSSSTRHHLKVLEEFEYIIVHDDGRYQRYYVNQNGYSMYANGNGYKEIISVLRKKTASRIVEYLMDHPGSNQKTIAEDLDLHPSTIHWHTKLLLKAKIIAANRIGKAIQYRISDPANVVKLLGYAN